MTQNTETEAVLALLENVPDGPWLYRPQRGDDWGVVRCSEPIDDNSFICKARDPRVWRESVLDQHRMAKTDPWEHLARFIAAARDLVPALLAERDAALTRVKELEAEGFVLAAGQCLFDHGEGLTGDPHGNPYCRKDEALSKALAEVAVLREALEDIVTDDTWGLEHATYMKCRTALANTTAPDVLTKTWNEAIEAAADICSEVIRDYDVMDASGTKYLPLKTQKAAKGLVSIAREDIRALKKGE